MGSYYYLIAQLPALVWGAAPPIKLEYFRDLCSDQLSAADFKLLTALEAGEILGGSTFVDRYRHWEATLRWQLARLRAARLKRDSGAGVEPPLGTTVYGQAAATAAKNAMATESALEAEISLDRARWEAVEALSSGAYFSKDAVFAYFIKLRLLERQAAFRSDRGEAAFQSLYQSVMSTATIKASGEVK